MVKLTCACTFFFQMTVVEALYYFENPVNSTIMLNCFCAINKYGFNDPTLPLLTVHNDNTVIWDKWINVLPILSPPTQKKKEKKKKYKIRKKDLKSYLCHHTRNTQCVSRESWKKKKGKKKEKETFNISSFKTSIFSPYNAHFQGQGNNHDWDPSEKLKVKSTLMAEEWVVRT